MFKNCRSKDIEICYCAAEYENGKICWYFWTSSYSL